MVSTNFKLGIMLVFSALYAETFLNIPPLEIVFQIYIEDIIFLLLLLVTISKLLHITNGGLKFGLWLGFAAIIFLNFFIGYSQYGTAAGVSFRNYFYCWVTGAFMLGSELGEPEANFIIKYWLIFAVILAVSVIFRWLIDPADIGLSWIKSNSWDIDAYEDKLRVISSALALILAQTIIVLLFLDSRENLPVRWKYIVILLAIEVIVLQHRSVWLALMCGVAAGIFALQRHQNRKYMRKLLGRLAFVAAAGVGIGFVIAITGLVNTDYLVESLTSSAVNAINMDTTVAARMNAWPFFLDKWQSSGIGAWAIGLPFGTSMVREVYASDGSVIVESFFAHNNYVQVLFDTGILGSFSFTLFYILATLKLFSKESEMSELHARRDEIFAVLIMQLVYYIAYGMHYSNFLWLGLAWAASSAIKKNTTFVYVRH